MTLHIIQKHILRSLSRQKELRYAQLKPSRIEGNQFSYHLKTLMHRGYVKKTPIGYTLTTKGVHYSTQVNFEHFFVRIQPKIVTLIVCKNKAGQYLVYTRNKVPFLGMVGFPYGKIHLGETVAKAAHRELKEKTGVSATLTQKAIVYLTVTDAEDEIITHMLCHVFTGSSPTGELLSAAPFGEIKWVPEKKVLAATTMPGVKEVLAIAKKKTNSLIFAEYEFQQG